MKHKLVGIVDYDCGNLHSIKNALDKIKVKNFIINNNQSINKATHIILPGVGAYDKAMKSLYKLNLISSLKKLHKKKPILGICLGMQLLFQSSEENTSTKGLGLIQGKVVKIKKLFPYKIPVIGWNKIELTKKSKNSLFKGIKNNSYFYFIHSYMVKSEKLNRNSLVTYNFRENHKVTAAVLQEKENVFGCQFHPEKSGIAGIKILKNFLNN